jgi:hypothetical protein
MTAETPTLAGYFPLWGARLDSDVGGWVGGGHLLAYVPNSGEWRQVSKTDVWIERLRYNHQSPEGPQPPLCLVAIETPEEGEDFGSALTRFGSAMTQSAEDGVLALRLFQAGWFLDPALAEQVFSFGPMNHRAPGPYRQIFLGGVPASTPPAYQLSIDALTTKLGEVGPVERIWRLIRQYRDGKPHSSADVAIDNFHLSYGYQLAAIQKTLFLFMALDAMLGGMSTPRFREVEINSSFRSRVAAAIQAHPGAEGTMDAKGEAGWLDSRGREIRNAAAHGDFAGAGAKAEKSYQRIQSIVRLVLHQYLAFSVRWAADSIGLSARLGIPHGSAPAAAYNRLLDLQAYGNTDASDLLQIDIST